MCPRLKELSLSTQAYPPVPENLHIDPRVRRKMMLEMMKQPRGREAMREMRRQQKHAERILAAQAARRCIAKALAMYCILRSTRHSWKSRG